MIGKTYSPIYTAVLLLFLTVSCSSNSNSLSSQTPEFISSSSAVDFDLSPTISPTSTKTEAPTATITTYSTTTPEVTSTPRLYKGGEPYPTAVAFVQDDTYIHDLFDKGYNLLFGSSTSGPEGYTYSAYIFLDSSFPIPTPNSPIANLFPKTQYRDTLWGDVTEGCRIVFYRSDGETNQFIASFGAPKYPEGSIYHDYPVYCIPNDWYLHRYPNFRSPDDDESIVLRLDGVWSDINQNGLPEFGVDYQYCPNACLNWGAISTHLYEIQTQSKVEDITADLPGVFENFNIVHSMDPLDFYVYDPTLWYCYRHCIIDTWWIYAWDGEKFIDVTSKYADEYIAQGQEVIERIQGKYGDHFSDSELLSILFIYEKAGLRDEAIDIFWELSNPLNWPDASREEICWLQYTRAKVMEDYKNGRPFSFPGMRLEGAALEFKVPFNPDWNLGFDYSSYDLTACFD